MTPARIASTSFCQSPGLMPWPAGPITSAGVIVPVTSAGVVVPAGHVSASCCRRGLPRRLRPQRNAETPPFW